MNIKGIACAVAAGATLVVGTVAMPSAVTAAAPTTLPFRNELGLETSAALQLQQEIEAALAKAPDAKQVSQFEITWDGGKVLEAFPAPGQRQAPPMSDTAIRASAPNARAAKRQIKAKKRIQTRGSSSSCPWVPGGTKYYCFYEDADFNGRRLQWSYQYCYSYNYNRYINFADYSFGNKASSWVNNSNHNISVFNGKNAGGALLWNESRVSNSPYVGKPSNDKAASFKAC